MNIFISSLAAAGADAYKNNDPDPAPDSIVEKKISYEYDGGNYIAYLAYDDTIKGARPAVIVLPEWWGLNEYTRGRAKQLAELGYVAMAIDVYGDGQQGNTPDEAQKLANTYYQNPALSIDVLNAAMDKLKTFPEVDASKIAAIGYCFGGSFVLNAAKLGADLKGVVSIHGGLKGVAPDKNVLKAKILVCHGAADVFEENNVVPFREEMEAAGVDYLFEEYAGATHAFSNPAATEAGIKFKMPIAYNAAADYTSWRDLTGFLEDIFR